MDIRGIYGDQLVKLLKLSESMLAAFSPVAFVIAPSTTRALIKREIMSDATGTWGCLTSFGEHVSVHIEAGTTGCTICDPITPSITEVKLPVIAGHRWERHTLPGEAVTEHSTYQAVVATSNCQVSGFVSYQARTGTWTATGRRNGMSAMVSANSWAGVTLPEALEALAVNVAENEAAYVARQADTIANSLTTEQAAFLIGGWGAVSRTFGIDEELRDLGLWTVSVGTTELGTRVHEILMTAPRFAAVAHQVAAIQSADLYPSPMEAGDFDRMNAAMEGASIRAEEAAEIAFDALLSELFPGDDDAVSTYAECEVQLVAERAGCAWCQLGKLATPAAACVEHVSVEAWVRTGREDANASVERMDALAFAAVEDLPIEHASEAVQRSPFDPTPFASDAERDAAGAEILASFGQAAQPGPVTVAMEGHTYHLTLRGKPVMVGDELADCTGDLFTVTGAKLSPSGNRHLVGNYRTGGIGSAPFSRFAGAEWLVEGSTVRMVARVTTSPWKTSAKSSKHKRRARR